MRTLTAPVASAAAAVKGLHCTPLATARGALDCRPRCGWTVAKELKLLCIPSGCFFRPIMDQGRKFLTQIGPGSDFLVSVQLRTRGDQFNFSFI